MGFWQAVGAIAATGIIIVRGREAVRQIVDLKVDRAKLRIDQLVNEIVLDQKRELMGAVLDEFGNQLQAAETYESQNEVNELLWYFKETIVRKIDNQEKLT